MGEPVILEDVRTSHKRRNHALIPHSSIITSFSILALLFVLNGQSAAQVFHAEPKQPAPPPAVLFPEPTYWFLGIIAGVNINQHEGDFITRSCERRFFEASGTGIHVGLQLEHMLEPYLGVAVKVLYNSFDADGVTFAPKVPTKVVDEATGTESELPLDLEYTSNVTLGYVTVNPVLELFPIGGLYLFGGPAVGLRVTSTYDCFARIVEPGFVFVSTGTETAENEQGVIDVPSAEGIRLDVRGGIGCNLRLGKKVTFAPEVSYIFPLTLISDDDDWKANAISAVAVLKIHL
ncbi:MAG: hypothetical protein CL946_06355 [Ectothiorhodospiraceae bacterium]|nr:hypothetical protein [Ectothiorhodospiraceae bacterium]